MIAIPQFLSLCVCKAVADFPAHINTSSFAFKIKCCDDHLKSPTNAAKGASVAAKTLAMTAIDFLLDEDLRKRAKAEFDEKMKDHPYVSPIPKGQKPILPEN